MKPNHALIFQNNQNVESGRTREITVSIWTRGSSSVKIVCSTLLPTISSCISPCGKVHAWFTSLLKFRILGFGKTNFEFKKSISLSSPPTLGVLFKWGLCSLAMLFILYSILFGVTSLIHSYAVLKYVLFFAYLIFLNDLQHHCMLIKNHPLGELLHIHAAPLPICVKVCIVLCMPDVLMWSITSLFVGKESSIGCSNICMFDVLLSPLHVICYICMLHRMDTDRAYNSVNFDMVDYILPFHVINMNHNKQTVTQPFDCFLCFLAVGFLLFYS